MTENERTSDDTVYVCDVCHDRTSAATGGEIVLHVHDREPCSVRCDVCQHLTPRQREKLLVLRVKRDQARAEAEDLHERLEIAEQEHAAAVGSLERVRTERDELANRVL